MRVLHLLASNKFSGAENVVCQIIDMFNGEIEMAYCSPDGEIKNTLSKKNIQFFPLKKLSKKEVKRVIKEFKPDIIHAHDALASVIGSKFANKFKVISHIHGNDKRRMGKLSIKSFLYNLSTKKISHIFWVSNSCFEDYYFKKNVKEKSTIFHNIINVNKFKESCDNSKELENFDVCYLGRLCEVKNPLRMLEIIKMAKDQKQNIKCAIIGDGDLREECELFVKNNNLEENVKFFGFVNNPSTILQNCRIMLMSSINEGTPMAMLEAFSLGVPIISTKVDGAVELIKNELMGSVYETNSEAVTQILKILNNKKEEYVNYLTKFSEEYNNIDNYKAKIINIYKF